MDIIFIILIFTDEAQSYPTTKYQSWNSNPILSHFKTKALIDYSVI